MRAYLLGVFLVVAALSGSAWAEVTVTYGATSGTYTIHWLSDIGTAQLRERKDGGHEYQIYRGTNSSFTVTGSTEGTYSYRVLAEEINCFPFLGCEWVDLGTVTVSVVPASQAGVPSSLSVSSPATGNYTVSWGQASGDVTSYTLQEAYMLGSWQTVYNGTARSRNFDKPAGAVYQYRVRACGASSCSAYTPAETVSVPNATLSASISPEWVDYTNSAFTLTWNSALTTGCSWSRGNISGVNGNVQASVSEGWEGFAYGQYRNISTITCNRKGGGTISTDVTVHAYELPPTPEVNVSWNKSSAYVGESATLSWSTSHASTCSLDGANVPANGSRSYTFSNNTSVSKTVTCHNNNGSDADSASIAVNYQAPGTPGTISAPATANTGTYSVSWGASSGALTSYQLQERHTGGSWSTVQTSTSRSRNFTKTTPNRRYEYRVRACNHNACSAYTSIRQVDVPHASITASVNPSPANYTSDTISLTWSSIMTTGCSWSEGSVSGTSGNVSTKIHDWEPLYIDELHRKSTTLTCNKIGGGTVTENIDLTAHALPPLPTIDVSWSAPGESVTLNWNSTNAVSCEINGDAVALSGLQTHVFNNINFSERVIQCTNMRGATTVTAPIPRPALTASWNMSSAFVGQTATVAWDAFGAETCRLEGEIVPHSGSLNIVMAYVGEVSRTLTCTNASGSSVLTPSISVNSPVLQAHERDPANDALDGDAYFGRTAGKHGVDNGGSFNYSVPIDVPPGISGVQPDMSLTYSSSRQNGLVGWGWDISGLSVISRCPASYIRDGYVSGISNDDNYKYCLDGQRLVLQSDGTYRTESESFKRITKNADSWVVENPDGSKLYYGENDDITNANSLGINAETISWLVDKQADAAGNYMTYLYQREGGNAHVAIKEIQYTKNDNTQSLSNAMRFYYEDREDVVARYSADTLFTVDQRLQRVEVVAGNALVYVYNLEYESNNGVERADPVATSRISSITKCFGGDFSCAEPVTFDWTSTLRDNYVLDPSDQDYVLSEDIAESRYVDTTEDIEFSLSYPQASTGGRRALLDQGVRGDYDGDNQLEVIWTVGTERYVAMSAGDSGSMFADIPPVPMDEDIEGGLTPQHAGDSMDFNGDGLDDFYIKRLTSLHVYLSNGTTLEHSPGYSMDEDQLGVIDSIVCCDLNDHVAKHWSYNYVMRDIDGDSLVDILRMPMWDDSSVVATIGDLDVDDISVARNNGNGFDAFERWATSTDFTFLNKRRFYSYLSVADVNGDALLDLVGLDGEVGINTGTSFTYDASWGSDINLPHLPDNTQIWVNAASIPGDVSQATGGTDGSQQVPGYGDHPRGYRLVRSGFNPYSSTTRVADMNGDGLADVVAVRYDGIYVALSTGQSFLPAELWTDELTYHELIPFCEMMECNTARRTFELQDANRDGMADILFTRAWTDFSPMQNASDILVFYSKGRVDGEGTGFTDPIEVASVAPRPQNEPIDQDAVRLGKPYVNEEGDLVIHRQPSWNKAEFYVFLGVPLVQSHDVAINIGTQPHQILSVNEAGARRIDVDYKRLSDPDVYTQTGATDGSSTLGQSTPTTYNFYSSDGSISVLPDHSVPSAARGQSLAASISVYDGSTFATREDYHYTNRRSHRRGLGGLGFESIQKTTTLAGKSDKLRRVEERLQEVGPNASYLLAVPAKTTECVISTDSAPGCDAHSGTRVLKRHSQQWKVRVYDDGAPHYHAYNVEEEIKTYDLTTREWLNTTSKRLFDDGVRQGCPMPASVTFDNRTVTSDVHFDAYGTPRNSVENRCDSFGVTGTHTQNDNILNDTTNWCLNLTQDAYVHRWIYDDDSGTTDTLTRHTNFQYHSSGPGVCQVERKIREPNSTDNAIWLQEDYQYNDYGTRDNVQETVRAFTLDGIGYTQRSASLTESYGTDGSRTVVTTNAEGHSNTQIFNAAFGSLARSIDANDLVSDHYYDVAGRLIYSDSLGVVTTYDYRDCDNCFAYNPKAAHYVQQKTEGQSATRAYFDALDRELGKRWRGLTGDVYFTGVKINVLGQVDTQTEPFGELDNPSGLETTFEYDILGRPVLTDFASGAVQSVNYHYVDGAAAVTTTDALGYGKTQRYDALGREKSVRDALGTYVHYWHDALGSVNQVRVTAEEGREVITSDAVTHNIVFDDLGRKLQLIDPDVGTLNYRYNAFGKLTEQINGEGQRICYFYDRLDRQTQRRDNANSNCGGGTAHTWSFDRAGELGLLAEVNGYDTSNRAQSEVYTYTLDYLLPETVTSVINGESYTITNAYDIFHRPVGQTYPTGFTIQNRYNDYGHLYRTDNAANGQMLWQADEDDARGNITQSQFENGVSVSSVFTATHGLLETRRATRSGQVLQDHEYTFDDEGNLRNRQDHRANVTQNFCYDPLYRLTDQVVNGSCSDDVNGTYNGTAYAYDIHGNILRKDGISDYIYGQNGAGDHAVTYANGGHYIYDDAGRMIGSPLGRQLQYSAFGKPTYMGIANQYETRIVYGAMQRRVEREDYDNGETTRTVYVGKQYERITHHDGSIEHRHYLGDWGIHVQEANKPSPESYNVYLTRDHIGSIASKSDNRDNDVKYHANEPWGRRQNQHWGGERYDTLSGDALKVMTFGTTRGFTDHEHLDGVGLIHMNGRVYDPVIGRFVSPDPWIQDPENSQSFNRYSYVWNNPLRYTDPTGEKTERDCGRCTIIDFGGGDSGSTGSEGTPLFSVTIHRDENDTIIGIDIKHLPGINVDDVKLGNTEGKGSETVKIDYSFKQMSFSATVESTAKNLGAKATPVSVNREVDSGGVVDPVVAKEVAAQEGMSIKDRYQITTFVDDKTGEHKYQIRGLVCSTSNSACNAEYANKVYGHVNANDVPFTDADLQAGPHNLKPFRFLPGDPITHTQNLATRVSVNIAEEGHRFYPGSVTLSVNFDGGNLYYDITGIGTGNNPGFNNSLGVALYLPSVRTTLEKYGF